MPEQQSGEIAELLQRWAQGDETALAAVVPTVYKELRRVAHNHLKTERADHTLQSTALVNEAFLRLVGSEPVQLQSRGHFIAIASRLMRQILVDYARTRRTSKRDGGFRISLQEVADLAGAEEVPILILDRALDELSRFDERQAKIVEMKFFGGLSAAQISELLGISLATVERDWRTARIWLRREMKRPAPP